MSSLDIENADSLIAYLRHEKRIDPYESPRIRVLGGGVSNKTVLVTRQSGEAWVLKQALSKLRVQADWFSDPARVHREAEGLRWLPEITSPGSTTALVFEDRAEFLLAMQAVPEPHENWKTMLLAGRLEREHFAQFGRGLAEIHRRSKVPGNLEEVFADRSFFESLRVEPYYLHSATVVPEAAAFLHDLVSRTRDRRLSLVHGDYSPKNILVRGDRLILLDHEVIHWGDPAFDVGFALTHLLSKANHLPAHRERFATAAETFWEDYSDNVSDDYSEWHIVRHTLGCLLARVAGRSPLEYLDADARARQQSAVLDLMQRPPSTVKNLIVAFVKRLER